MGGGPVVLGVLWLSAIVEGFASLFGDAKPWDGWSEPPSAGVVVFGWSLGLLPTFLLTGCFMLGPGAAAQPGALL